MMNDSAASIRGSHMKTQLQIGADAVDMNLNHVERLLDRLMDEARTEDDQQRVRLAQGKVSTARTWVRQLMDKADRDATRS
jgi:hypothetical protein